MATATGTWQTRVGKRQKVGKLLPSQVVKLAKGQITTQGSLQNGRLMQWHSRRTVKRKKKREQIERGGEIKRFAQNPVCTLVPPPFSFVCF